MALPLTTVNVPPGESDSPNPLMSSVEDESSVPSPGLSSVRATAFASIVLPWPGGPGMRMTRGLPLRGASPMGLCKKNESMALMSEILAPRWPVMA